MTIRNRLDAVAGAWLMARMNVQAHYRVRIEGFFEAAHNLRSYQGKPEPLHGHSWKVEAEAEASKPDSEGMALDFAALKKELNARIAKLDCAYINEIPPFTDLAPSAENIARWLFDELEPGVRSEGCRLVEVRVWEGRHASASYRSAPPR
ncbi:MAG: 6-carboxytetrahydropterin synthase [Pseudomonadota bacterium]